MKTLHDVQHHSAFALLVAMVIALVGLGPSTALAHPGLQTRPLRVTQEADFVIVGTCGEFDAPLQAIAGTGQATHLGRFESYGVTCLSDPTNFITWTAPNGDTITIEYTSDIGPISPLDGSASIALEAVTTTGTGRFARVSFGEDDVLAGTIWLAPDGSGHLEVSLDGTITYDASDGSNR